MVQLFTCWISFKLLLLLQCHLSHRDGFKHQLEFRTWNPVCQTPDQKLSDLFLGVVLIVGREQVKGISVLVHGGNFKRRPSHLLCRCSWIKPADILNISFVEQSKAIDGVFQASLMIHCILLYHISINWAKI